MAPLKETRVVDLCSRLNGSYCTSLLGDLETEVIKVEPPRKEIAAVAYAHAHSWSK